jgi:hypothetical protein
MIRFELLQTRNVTMEMRDLQGRLIQSVQRGQLPAGNHQVDLNVSDLQAGIYTYSLVADGMRLTKKMIVK